MKCKNVDEALFYIVHYKNGLLTYIKISTLVGYIRRSLGEAMIIFAALLTEHNFGNQFGNQDYLLYLCPETKKDSIMVIVNSREFRANQGKYLGMAAQGNGVILRSRSHGCFKITPVSEDDTLMSKEEFLRRIDNGLRQIREGHSTTLRSEQELKAFMDSL